MQLKMQYVFPSFFFLPNKQSKLIHFYLSKYECVILLVPDLSTQILLKCIKER